MNRAELRPAEMMNRNSKKNRVSETVETVSKVRSLACCNPVKRVVNERRIFSGGIVFRDGISRPECRCYEEFASGFFEEKSRGEIHKTKPTKKVERTLRRPKENE